MGLMMDKKDLKKLLAGLSLVALIGGAGLTVSGCVTTGNTTSRADETEIDTSTRDNTDGNLTG
jgi:radical SAM modification target selenobiotic family peptide